MMITVDCHDVLILYEVGFGIVETFKYVHMVFRWFVPKRRLTCWAQVTSGMVEIYSINDRLEVSRPECWCFLKAQFGLCVLYVFVFEPWILNEIVVDFSKVS